MLGISVYMQDLDVNYIKEASLKGAKYIFTSLQIPEEDYSDLDEKLKMLLEACDKYQMELTPDISPFTFEKLGIEANDYKKLKEMGFKTLRLDYGFDDFEIVKELMKDYKLLLNASVMDEAYLLEAEEAGIDLTEITATHNFYPRNNTALSYEDFIKKNLLFKRFGVKVQAFVCGDDLKRFPLYEGLPTVEKHREKDPYVAAVDLMNNCYVDDVMIGDSKAKIETLDYIKQYMEENIMCIKVHLEKPYEYLYDEELKSRKDLAESVVRLNTPRQKIEVYHNSKRNRGSITMDNRLAGRYSGELQLLKKDMPMDARVNVIGFVHPEYIDLLDEIDGNTRIRFVRI